MRSFMEILDERFAIPAKKKYPLSTKDQLERAVSAFNDIENIYKPTMAKNILKAAEKLNIYIRKKEILEYADIKNKDDENKGRWRKKFGHLNLSKYPPDHLEEGVSFFVKEENIEKGGVILSWKDKKGKQVLSYANDFLDKNAEIKWERIKDITDKDIKKINDDTIFLIKSSNESDKDSGAIIRIILLTGSESGLKDTGNKGISTLSYSDIKVNGNKIKLDFTGKSYQQNTSEFEDAILANYLKDKIKNKTNDNDLIFDKTNKTKLSDAFKKISKSEMKIKDLRTYTGSKIAKDFIEKNELPPLPLSESNKQAKKDIEKKLATCWNVVSTHLNNEPAVARDNYIIPEIINNWLDDLNIDFVERYKIGKGKGNKKITESVNHNYSKEAFDECDIYPTPEWFENEDWILIKKIKAE